MKEPNICEDSVLTVVLYSVSGSPWRLELEFGFCSVKTFNKIFEKDAWSEWSVGPLFALIVLLPQGNMLGLISSGCQACFPGNPACEAGARQKDPSRVGQTRYPTNLVKGKG